MMRGQEVLLRSVAVWLLVALVGLAPGLAHACSVCIAAAPEEVRKAFVETAAFLTVCPLLLMGSFGWWLRRRFRAADEDASPHPSPSPTTRP